MVEFLIASAIGMVFALIWPALLWPVGAMLLAAASMAAAFHLPFPALVATLALTILGYNAGLLAGLLAALVARHAGGRTRPPARATAARSPSSRLSSGA